MDDEEVWLQSQDRAISKPLSRRAGEIISTRQEESTRAATNVNSKSATTIYAMRPKMRNASV